MERRAIGQGPKRQHSIVVRLGFNALTVWLAWRWEAP
jgi:hypothetical protein